MKDDANAPLELSRRLDSQVQDCEISTLIDTA